MNLATVRTTPEIAGEQLTALMQQLHTHAGITIDSTSGVVAGYVQERMNYLGVEAVDDYLALFDDSISARAEWLALTDLLTVKETRFFRQPEAFDCLAVYLEELLGKGPAPSELSFWSAGCSTGQELYSMAMIVEQAVRGRSAWLQWHGIGSDISFKAIHQAQQAIYPAAALRTLPAKLCEQYMEPKLGGRYRVSDNISSRTHFFHSNLLHVDGAPFADFNVVFCQNVLIYFPRERQRWIINQLVDRLKPGGLLILGAGEDVSWLNQSVRRMKYPGVCAYQKTGG